MNRYYLLRAERGLTQYQVAKGSGISRATVIRLESQENPKPTADVVRKLATYYGIEVHQLLGMERAA